MKICAIGDPHGNLEAIKKAPKDVDLYLLTGDLGKADLARQRFFENLERKQKGLDEIIDSPKNMKAMRDEVHNSTMKILKFLSQTAPVYTIEGNVGLLGKTEARADNEKYGIKVKPTLQKIKKLPEASLVKNQLRNINDIRVGFLEYFVDTSWIREFRPSEYREKLKKAKKQTDKAKRILKRFGNKIDILLCHQPPYGVLDKVSFKGAPKNWQGKHAGSKAILNYIKKHQPKYVFCGHIHEGEGKTKIGKSQVYNLGCGSWKVIEI